MLDDSSFIGRLDPVLARPFKEGFTTSLDLIFLLAMGVIAVSFVVLFFLPEVPLRGGAPGAQSAPADGAAAGEATGSTPNADRVAPARDALPGVGAGAPEPAGVRATP